uniref:Purple acid phosphatase n=1 Tax=Panagrolaimus sp. ES5 TaxID=591445 RepID=A0AC34F5K9_9BILA
MYSFLIAVILLFAPIFGASYPEQVHISLGEDAASMVVTWVTFHATASPIVQYGPTTAMIYKKVGHTNDFEFNYKVGTADGWSKQFQFKTFPAGNDFKFRVCVFGDLAYHHGNSIPDLMEAAKQEWFDMIIHVGDIAYDLHAMDDDGHNIGDKYMRELEPVFSKYPYMVVAGNHENDGKNFSHFHNRFRMPGENNGHHNNQYYSFNVGPAHFFGASTELYGYRNEYGDAPIIYQYNWLNYDLQKANKNRANRPWIIGYQHRPFYCSNTHCPVDEEPIIRNGLNNIPGLEPLYIENKIDLQFWGHMHSYERFYPIANLVPQGTSYHNAKAPAYIVTGSAGCHTPGTPFGSPHPGSAFRSDDWGYTIMSVYNHTHIHLYQWSVNKQKNIDEIWITKDIGH